MISVEKCVSVVIMDGVTLGHPCCAVHNCKEPLVTSHNCYCQCHKDENQICAVIGCKSPILHGSMTCNDPVHRRIEGVHLVCGQARFQLKERLHRARVAHPVDGIPQETNISAIAGDATEEDIFDIDPSDNTVLPQSNEQVPQKRAIRIRAQFGQKRTHNEQILVAPCGMILGRTMFFGAEAISSCVVSFTSIFAHSQNRLIISVYRNLSSKSIESTVTCQTTFSSITIVNLHNTLGAQEIQLSKVLA